MTPAKPEPVPVYPMRINKYLALMKYSTRRDADEIIKQGRVTINGRRAVLGDKVLETDIVDVTYRPKQHRYFAYHKPRGIITHSPQGEEESIAEILPIANVFPIGRLDKDSSGLIILTDDGRITDPLLNPENAHEKEYEVETLHELPVRFKEDMEAGVDIGEYITKPCKVTIIHKRKFSIVLTEGKNRQIRRMCGVFGASAVELKRVRIMNVRLGQLQPGEYRTIEGAELTEFLQSLGL